jgi:hypothetical protein
MMAGMEETLNDETVRAEEFPVIARHAWVNHAAISPWPAVVARAVQAYVDDNRHGPGAGWRSNSACDGAPVGFWVGAMATKWPWSPTPPPG